MGNSADPAVQTAQISAKSAQAQAVLESAKNRLATTTQMLTTAQDNYVKTTDMLLQQQNKLADIQATLTNLTASNISLVSDCYIAVVGSNETSNKENRPRSSASSSNASN